MPSDAGQAQIIFSSPPHVEQRRSRQSEAATPANEARRCDRARERREEERRFALMRPRPQVAMATRATPNWKVDFAMGPENMRAHMRGADYRSRLDSPKGSRGNHPANGRRQHARQKRGGAQNHLRFTRGGCAASQFGGNEKMSARQKRAGTKPFKVCVWGMGRQSVRRPRKISARQKRAGTKPFKVCVWGMGRQSVRRQRKMSARQKRAGTKPF